jgi:hypothetical protein
VFTRIIKERRSRRAMAAASGVKPAVAHDHRRAKSVNMPSDNIEGDSAWHGRICPGI